MTMIIDWCSEESDLIDREENIIQYEYTAYEMS